MLLPLEKENIYFILIVNKKLKINIIIYVSKCKGRHLHQSKKAYYAEGAGRGPFRGNGKPTLPILESALIEIKVLAQSPPLGD